MIGAELKEVVTSAASLHLPHDDPTPPEKVAQPPFSSILRCQLHGINVHLKHRDVTVICVSRALYKTLAAYKKRMGWDFTWVSSGSTDFNFDYHFSITPERIAEGKAFFNYKFQNPGPSEREGHSVFYKDRRGDVFHTYASYSRGNELFNLHYHYLDVVPKGRDENGRGPFWVKRHDEYDQ